MVFSSLIIGCKNEGSESRVKVLNQDNFSSDKSQLVLVNKKFIEALLNKDSEVSVKIKNAFYALKVFEPILYGVTPGNVEQKLMASHLIGGDFSKFKYSSTITNYSYSLINTENIFNIELPSYPKKIINQWTLKDTTYYQILVGADKFETEALYSYISENNDTVFVLNGNVEMLDLSKYMIIPYNQNEISHSFYFNILNSLALKYCHDSLEGLYEFGVSEFWDYSKGLYEGSWNIDIIEYGKSLNTSGQLPFKTKHLNYAEVKIFPRYKDRKALNINSLEGVCGINQFFMDHDLTTGFVHPYTNNFYDKLSDDGYLLVYDRSTSRINQGRIYYKKKSELAIPTDKLGQNIAFCRQWKLSEFDIKGNEIMMRKSSYSTNSFCPQIKAGSTNYYYPEVPLWSTYRKEGYVDYRLLNSLTDYDGGTVAIIWTTNKNQTLFMDMHGSIADIIAEAIKIKNLYNVDPTIGIYDAGPFARKFKANVAGSVDFNLVNKLTGRAEFVGAGYGFIK